MLFGESPMFPNSHKFICFGEQSNLQEDVLNCLRDKRHKLKLNLKRKENQPAVINVQQDFKMNNKEESHTWTVWSLGENCHPFFPCFFCSNSVFLVFCTLNKRKEHLKRLSFWLDEISRCWSQSNVFGNAQIILLVHANVSTEIDIQKEIVQIVDPILQSDRFNNLTLRGVSVIQPLTVNHVKEYEWFSDSTPFSFNTDSTSTPITGKQVGRISQLLERIAKETTRPVSPRWIAFSKKLRVMRESIIKWTDFVQMAASCGVGALCGLNPEVDLEMCCDFLSDTGSIIHFRHPLWSKFQTILCQFVVLKLEWFNKLLSDVRGISFLKLLRDHQKPLGSEDTDSSTQFKRMSGSQMADFAQRILSGGHVQTWMPDISSWMSSLLQELQLAFMCDNVPHLSFSLMPGLTDSPMSYSLQLLLGEVWPASRNQPLKKVETIVCGRTFHIDHIHEGMFTQLMNMVRQIPGMQPEVFWKTGMWISKKCEGVTQDLFIIEKPGDSISVLMRTTFSSPATETCHSHSLGLNLAARVLMWLNIFFQVNNLPAVQSFYCPHCLKDIVLGGGPLASLKNFEEGEVLMAARDATSILRCPFQKEKHQSLNLTEIAPELSCLKVDTTPTSQSNGQIIYEGENAQHVAGTILPVIYVLSEIPKQTELLKYTGARIHDGTKLLVESETIPLEFPPNHPFPEIVPPLNLRELLMMRPSTEVSSFIGSLLTMSLREKILRDVAKALDCLHSQHPPLVHDGLFLEDGSLTLFSLPH
ncbi:hypothetical protein Pelo_513 [Pelomyxa schiedti]|nr:hypothetical protein Pelo_513 [Pelomyxa schiedti]